MSTRRAARRLADRMQAATATTQTLRYRTGVVDSVSAGAGTDGNDVLNVTVGADTLPMTHLQPPTGWTPAAGDLVAVLFVNGSPLVLGHPIGLPDF